MARLSDRTETTVSDEVIDRRLEFLWQRVLKAQHDYHYNNQDTPEQFHADLDAYNNAVSAYYQSADRYDRDAPSLREYNERLNGHTR